MNKNSLVLNSKLFMKWREKFNSQNLSISSVKVKLVISRTLKDFYLAVLDINLKKKYSSKTFPRCLVLRGDSVIIVPIIKCIEDEKLYTILVEQFRIVDGGDSLEFPAGMIDYDIGIKKSAVIECKEELGMDILEKDLIPLSNSAFKVCESLMDENVYIFAFKLNMQKEKILKFHGLKTGDIQQNEDINLKVLEFSEIKKIRSFSTFVAYHLAKEIT